MANFMTNVVEKQIDPFGTLFRPVFQASEDAFNIIFAFELAFNMYGNWCKRFWKSTWNQFDFVVVMVGMVSLSWWKIEFPEPLKLLRILRALRVFRLFKRVKSLNKIIQALALAMPGTCNAFVVLFLFLTIFAILGVEFFKDHGTVRAEPGGPPWLTPLVCQYASLHRPWQPPFFFNITDPNDPVLVATRGTNALDLSAAHMTSWDEYDRAQWEYSPKEYYARQLANAHLIPARTARQLCFSEEYFQDFTRSWFTLFQVLTTESWAEAVARPIQFHWIGSEDQPFPTALAWILSTFFFMGHVDIHRCTCAHIHAGSIAATVACCRCLTQSGS